jgi:hypothetical protein
MADKIVQMARIDDGVVINIEIASLSWIEQNQDRPDGHILIGIPDDIIVPIGSFWSRDNGFYSAYVKPVQDEPPAPPIDEQFDKEIEDALNGD